MRPKDKQGDCVSCRAKLKFESSIGSIIGPAKCKNPKAEEDIEQFIFARLLE